MAAKRRRMPHPGEAPMASTAIIVWQIDQKSVPRPTKIRTDFYQRHIRKHPLNNYFSSRMGQWLDRDKKYQLGCNLKMNPMRQAINSPGDLKTTIPQKEVGPPSKTPPPTLQSRVTNEHCHRNRHTHSYFKPFFKSSFIITLKRSIIKTCFLITLFLSVWWRWW